MAAVSGGQMQFASAICPDQQGMAARKSPTAFRGICLPQPAPVVCSFAGRRACKQGQLARTSPVVPGDALRLPPRDVANHGRKRTDVSRTQPSLRPPVLPVRAIIAGGLTTRVAGSSALLVRHGLDEIAKAAPPLAGSSCGESGRSPVACAPPWHDQEARRDALSMAPCPRPLAPALAALGAAWIGARSTLRLALK